MLMGFLFDLTILVVHSFQLLLKSLALMILICVASFPLLIRCTLSNQPKEQAPVVEDEIPPLPDEVVHEDLGDAPVVKEEHITLNELEKRVQLGELKMKMTVLDKGESLITLLSQEGVPSAERMKMIEALELLINLKTLKTGMNFMFFKDGPDVVGLSLSVKENENIAVIKEADSSWTPFSHTGRVETRPIKPEESVWYDYEKILTNNYNRNFSFGNSNIGETKNIVKAEVVNPLNSKGVVEINTGRLPELIDGYPYADINKMGKIYKYTDGVKIFVYANEHYINLSHDSTTRKAFTATADDILPQEKIEDGEFIDIFVVKKLHCFSFLFSSVQWIVFI